MKDIFISHCWGKDELDRDNHLRCKNLTDKLLNSGYSVWFDSYDMSGNIDSSIMKGINNAKVIIICLTHKYCEKINNAVLNRTPNDNCYKEWNYSLFKQKKIIPVILEPCMINTFLNEDGIIQMYLNSTMFIDFSNNFEEEFVLLKKNLKLLNVYNIYEKKFYKIDNSNSFNNFVKSLTGMSLKSLSPRTVQRLSKNFENEKCDYERNSGKKFGNITFSKKTHFYKYIKKYLLYKNLYDFVELNKKYKMKKEEKNKIINNNEFKKLNKINLETIISI